MKHTHPSGLIGNPLSWPAVVTGQCHCSACPAGDGVAVMARRPPGVQISGGHRDAAKIPSGDSRLRACMLAATITPARRCYKLAVPIVCAQLDDDLPTSNTTLVNVRRCMGCCTAAVGANFVGARLLSSSASFRYRTCASHTNCCCSSLPMMCLISAGRHALPRHPPRRPQRGGEHQDASAAAPALRLIHRA